MIFKQSNLSKRNCIDLLDRHSLDLQEKCIYANYFQAQRKLQQEEATEEKWLL